MTNKNEILNFIKANKLMLHDKFYLSKIALFGSYARQEADETSDIDLLIEFEGTVSNIHKIKQDLKIFFEKQFNISVDICREKYIKPYFREMIFNEAIYI
jgi:uncharacterized protein